MKIVFFIDCLGSGGAQRQLVNIAVALKKKGYDVHVVIYYNRMFYAQTLLDNDITINTLFDLSYKNRITGFNKLMKNIKPSVVIAFLEGPAVIASICKLISSHRFKLIVGERSSNPNILTSVRLRGYRLFHLIADYVVANSYANLRLVNQAIPILNKKKQKVIYNMIDHEYWKPFETNKSLENNKFRIVVAASHQHLKNCHNMILAISKLPIEMLERLEVVWFGDEREDNSYKEACDLVVQLNLVNCIFFKAATKDIKNEMLHADCIGLFSFYEGLPNVVCEAMSLGKPVICSDISDISLLLKTSECVFDPKDVSSICASFEFILSLSEDQLKMIGNINLDSSRNFFEMNEIVSAYEELF
ncbi:glycosyltransferase [Myroides marinus]|uniref:glycosyltransferase n=1 Tax=Myroides marinus TaxID=703342 RepID=UPI002575810A|nr:glycosyltransferase [Myroides marinus]MDM1355969.1 glycosyltransferase [Myroides marinus]